MAKGYNVLAGFLRDVRNARGDASEGSVTAQKLVDDLDDEMELLLERVDGPVRLGDGGDDEAFGDDASDDMGDAETDLPEPAGVRPVDGDRPAPAEYRSGARRGRQQSLPGSPFKVVPRP